MQLIREEEEEEMVRAVPAAPSENPGEAAPQA